MHLCTECGSGVHREDDGRNVVVFCGDCGLVVTDELFVTQSETGAVN